MNRIQIEKLITGHYKKIKGQAILTAATLDANAAHLVRIEYKKLRAFLRLLIFNGQLAATTKALKKLRQLYKITGAIRELQLQQQFIIAAVKKPFKKSTIYFHHLQNQIITLQKELEQLPIKKMVHSGQAAIISNLPHQTGKSKFIAFFNDQKTAAEKIITAGNFSDNNIHSIRKILKDLCHNLYVYRKYVNSAKKQPVKETIQHYELVLKELGSFYDKCSAISLLQRSLPKLPTTNEQQLLLQLKKDWLKQKLLMKKELVKKLKADADILLNI